jgi:hypothetical protein
MRIENQIPNIKQQVAVSATGFTYGTYLGLCTRDCRAKSYIINSGLTIANHLDSVYNGLGDASTYLFHNNDSLFADVSMGIVFNIGTIKAGDSTILSFAYLLKKTSIDSLFANEFAPHWAFKGREIANKDTVKACDGEVFQLGIIAPGTINWVWSASPFLSTTIGDANWVIANGTNTYRAIRSDAARCGSNDTLQITVKTVPVPMPLISKSGITLSVPNIFVHYNWYKGDTLLSSTDSNTYDLIQNGNYYVIVTDTNGCFVSSDTLYVNGFHDDVSIDELSDNDRVISYPNPCYDVINIRNAQSSTITLSDLSGRVLLSQNNASSINVSNLASGVYLLRIYNRQGELLGINKILKRSYD